MYLPQYHPIPENNKFWGNGFTEWVNVAQAKPLFKGHYQPRIPADLGFYDLRLSEVREAQAEMARQSGVEGFMYWHYWFGNGQMLLERPFQEVLKSGSPDFPFCLGWANHSWSTKTWTKGQVLNRDVMIQEQQYLGEEDYINHFNYVLPAFKDKRYITVDQKPIFLIYDPMSIKDIDVFINTWKKLAKENGLKGIHIVGMQDSRITSYSKLKNMGFDAVNCVDLWLAECKIKGGKWFKILNSQISNRLWGIALQKFQYKDIISYSFSAENMKEDVYPTVIPGYDRTARSGRQAVIYDGSTPELFGKHIDMAMDVIKDKEYEHKILFLKSWNEWGEGNYMEPDLKHGRGYLNELQKRIL